MKPHQAMKNETLWNHGYIWLVIINTFTAVSFNMVATTLSQYIVSLNFSLTVAGVITGIFSITALLIRPFSGAAADQFNKKKILIVSTALIGISVLGYTLSTDVVVIAFFRVLHGVAFGACSTAIVAMATRYIPEGRMGEGIGYLGMGQIIATAVAPGLGIYIYDYYGATITFLASSGLAWIGTIILVLFKYEDSPSLRTERSGFSFKNLIAKEVWMFTTLAGIYSFINGVITAFILLYAISKGVPHIGAYFVVSTIFLFLARPISGWVMDRKGLSYVIYPAMILTIISLVILGTSSTLWLFLVSAALRALGQGAAQPSLQAASIKRAGLQRIGVATSTFYIGADIGQGIGPIIGGLVAASLGYEKMFYMCAVLVIGAMLLYMVVTDKEKRNMQHTLEQAERKGASV